MVEKKPAWQGGEHWRAKLSIRESMLRTEMGRKGTYAFLRNLREVLGNSLGRLSTWPVHFTPKTHATGHWGHSTEGDAAPGL